MSNVTISIDAGGTLLAFQAVANFARDLTPAMDEIGQMMLTSTALRFEQEVDPDGNAWAPLAPSTLKAKQKSGHEKILQVSGRLAASVQAKAGPDSVRLGTNLIYAAIQQFGGMIKKYAQSRKIYRKFTEMELSSGGVLRELQDGFAPKSESNFTTWHEVPEHAITIPARPYVGISDDDLTGAIEILQRHLQHAVAA